MAGGSIAFEVEDVDGLTEALRGKGYRVMIEPVSTPGCRMSVVVDSEGNSVILHKVTVVGQ